MTLFIRAIIVQKRSDALNAVVALHPVLALAVAVAVYELREVRESEVHAVVKLDQFYILQHKSNILRQCRA